MNSEDMKIDKVMRQPLPTYYKALCVEASNRMNGCTYKTAGWALAIHLEDYLEWAIIKALRDSYFHEKEIRKLFSKHMRGFLKLVPYKRRNIFYRGVRQAFEEVRI
jgi:hypothetical protein